MQRARILIQSLALSGAVGVAVPAWAQEPDTGQLSLEERVTRIERLLESQVLVDMMMRLEALQRETHELRGAVETQGHSLDSVQRRQRDMYLDLDRRLQSIETGLAAGAGPASKESAGSEPTGSSAGMLPGQPETGEDGASSLAADAAADATASDGSASPTSAEQDAYHHAFQLLNQRRYDQAITAFQAFLEQYPSSGYAANAQYWLGEANYVTRRFPQALEEFNHVVAQYPDSRKVPDALLKVGFTFYEMRQWEQARQVLTSVIAKYPNSAAARLSQDRLDKMKLEGR